jgi:hypothetical protein
VASKNEDHVLGERDRVEALAAVMPAVSSERGADRASLSSAATLREAGDMRATAVVDRPAGRGVAHL